MIDYNPMPQQQLQWSSLSWLKKLVIYNGNPDIFDKKKTPHFLPRHCFFFYPLKEKNRALIVKGKLFVLSLFDKCFFCCFLPEFFPSVNGEKIAKKKWARFILFYFQFCEARCVSVISSQQLDCRRIIWCLIFHSSFLCLGILY